MKRLPFYLFCTVLTFAGYALGASKPHTVTLGKFTTVKVFTGMEESTPVEIRVRPLFVDGRTKEFTTGVAHDVTDRMFVVQRVYRLNDMLPQETGAPRWRWQRGGWLLVDRMSGRIQTITLPAFDPESSLVSWFRDYAAYCGLSDDGAKELTIVVQLGKRKPLLKKALVGKGATSPAVPSCPAPLWSRAPARVTFDPAGEEKFTFTVRSHAVDLVSEEEEEAEK